MAEVEMVAAKLGLDLPIPIDQRIAGAEKVGESGGRGRGGTGRTSGRCDAPYAHGLCLYEPAGNNGSGKESKGVNENQTGSQNISRWWRLAAAVTAMIMIGNLQYAWTLFVPKIIANTGRKQLHHAYAQPAG